MSVNDENFDFNSIIDDDNEDTQKDRYLLFQIAEEIYAIEIVYILEIVGIQKITPVPNIKNFVKGIINLRGIIVPVVDIRKRFGLDAIEYNEKTCIVVVNFNEVLVGLIVDEVAEVINIPEEQTVPAPVTNKGSRSRFIESIGKVGNEVKMILNLHRVLYDEDLFAAYEKN